MTADFHFDTERDLYANQKAEVLIQALPWLRTFNGATVVIKYGGHAMINPELQRHFANDVLFLHQVGLKPVIVHGGGPQISQMLSRLNIDTEFRGGLRVTSRKAMDVVRMVLTGQVQRELVSLLNTEQAHAVGVSGEDGGLLRAKRRTITADGENVDLGHVGDISDVNPAAVADLLGAGRIPIVSTVAMDADRPGEVLNVNADSAAAALAEALQATKLVILTDVAGLYADWPDTSSLITRTTTAQVAAMLPTLEAGMVPKMEACLRAVNGGVGQAHIIDGRREHSLLLEIFTPEGIGTVVTREEHHDQLD